MCTVLLPPGVNPIAVNKYIKYQYIVKVIPSTITEFLKTQNDKMMNHA